MFRFWLEFPPFLILLWLLFFFTVTGTAVHWVQCRSPLRDGIKKCALVGPYFTSVSILFALFVGFLLANAVSQKNRAFQAIQSEASALLILNVHGEAARDGAPAVRDAIGAYARSVIADEWPRMIEEETSRKTEGALLALIRVVSDRAVADAVGPAIHGQMLSLAEKISDSRAERIALVTSHAQRFAWTALFLLGILTQVAIGMVHLERTQANAAAIVIYSASAVIALWLIAIQENPFRGAGAVSPAPIEQVARTASA